MYNVYKDWILDCLGVYGGGYYIDEVAKTWGVDVCDSPEEMQEMIHTATQAGSKANLGALIITRIFDLVVEQAVKEFDVNKEDFSYVIDGRIRCDLTYKGEIVYDWEDLMQVVLNDKNNNKE